MEAFVLVIILGLNGPTASPIVVPGFDAEKRCNAVGKELAEDIQSKREQKDGIVAYCVRVAGDSQKLKFKSRSFY